MVKLLLVFLVSCLGFGQNLAKLGLATQVDEPGSTAERASLPKPKIIDRPAPKECSAKDQVSLPQQDLLALMIYRGKSIKANASFGGDYLNVELESPIIGNCASMLQPQLTYSVKHSKYIYEVKVRKTCEKPECEYQVSSLADGEKKVFTRKYQPTLSGFYSCMQENVGLNEDKTAWDKSKIVNKDLAKVSEASPVTSKLLMVSRGPVGMQNSGKKNLIDNNDCDFFEQISDKSYTHYSSDELKYMNLQKEAQALCQSDKYMDIESSLSNFIGHNELYQSMIKVRDNLLLEEVKTQRAMFLRMKKDKVLGDLRSEKLKTVSEDFYNLIIDKNMSTINHTDADRANDDLLVNLRARYQQVYDTGDYDEADRIAGLIEQKINELSKYMVAPYFTAADYKSMVDLDLNPDLENSDWKEATLSVHKSIITLKLLCEAYGSNDRCMENKTKNENFKKKSRLESIEQIAERSDEYSKNVNDSYDEKVALISNPNAYKSLKYVKLIKQCESHNKVAEQYAKDISAQLPAITQSCQQSSRNNPQELKTCIDRYKFQISGDAESLKLKVDNCKTMQAHYKSQKEKWEGLESQRDDYKGFSEAEKKKRKSKVDKKVAETKYDYSFKYKGITQSQSTQRTSQTSSGWPQINSAMNRNTFNTGFNTNFNSSFNNNSFNQFNSNPYNTNSYNMFNNQGFNNSGFNQGFNNSGFNQGYNNFYMQNYRSPSAFNGFNNNFGNTGQAGMNFNYGFNGQQQQNNYNYGSNNLSNGFMFNSGGANTMNPGTTNNQSGGFMFDFN